MKFVRLISPEGEVFERATELYRASFPAHEHRDLSSQKHILTHPEYHYDLIDDGGVFVGLMLYWETERFLYVEHFCIKPDLRGKNYGSAALNLLGKKRKPVVLEIDPLTDETALRRKAFYERAGFCANPYAHRHPPYQAGALGHELIVMTCPEAFSPGAYDEFAGYLKETVMGQASPIFVA